jgi:cystathionine beta-lyase/cystathionine gamma-synthase
VTLFYTDSPTNPHLKCIDIKLVAELCHRKGTLVCIDSTLASPINQKPLTLGADIVVHSATKYIAGHHDVSPDHISSLHIDNLIELVSTMNLLKLIHLLFQFNFRSSQDASVARRRSSRQYAHGTKTSAAPSVRYVVYVHQMDVTIIDVVSSPILPQEQLNLSFIKTNNFYCNLLQDAAYMIIRGLKTMALRVETQNCTSLRMARLLENHPKIENVYYPGLKSSQWHSIAKGQMTSFGGVISFEVASDLHGVMRFIDALEIPFIATSLGGCESLVQQPAVMSFWYVTF